jgi:short-subunit dehydrogenase
MTGPAPVVVITGASSGIGWHTAETLAREGATLVLAARRKEKLEELAAHLRDEHRVDVVTVPTDVRRMEDVRHMIKETIDRFGRIDVLVNNAGILQMAPFDRMTVETMRDVFETNFWSLVHAIRAVVPQMEKQGKGHIINVGSGVSRRGLPFMGAYTASKFALAGLTESIRVELHAKGIRFTSVYPGGVDTPMPHGVDRGLLPPRYRSHSRHYIRPERVARAISRAIRRRPLEVYVPWWLRYGAWLCVAVPGLADWMIRKRQSL